MKTPARLLTVILTLGIATLATWMGCKHLGGGGPTLGAAPGNVTCPPGFRTFVLANQASQTVWIGQTGGAAPPPFACTEDLDCGPNQQCQNPRCTGPADCNSGNQCDLTTGQCQVAPNTTCNGGQSIVPVTLSKYECTGQIQAGSCAGCPNNCDQQTGLCLCDDGGTADPGMCPTGTGAPLTCSKTVNECNREGGGTCFFQTTVPGENVGCADAGDACPTGQACNVALGLCTYTPDGGPPPEALALAPDASTTLCVPAAVPGDSVFASRSPAYTKCTQDSDCQSNRCLQGSGQNINSPPADCVSGASCVCRPVVGWSGGFFGRTGCADGGTNCLTGDCGNAPNQPCPIGKGGTNPFSAAELTLQPNDLDFYDVTIINGVNLSVQMGPLPGSFQPANPPSPYSCRTAGSTQAQTTPDAGTLEACSWQFEPDLYVTSDGGTDGGSASALLKAVALPVCASNADCPANHTCNNNLCWPQQCRNTVPYCDGNAVCTNPSNPTLGLCSDCTRDSDCSGDGGASACGTAFVPGFGGLPLAQTCGTFKGWWSYEDLCTLTPAPFTYGPLNCNALVPAPPDGGPQDTLSNLFQCAGQYQNSCYNGTSGNVAYCCGCATFPGNPAQPFWPTTLQTGNNPQYADAGECVNNNVAWASIVQPWLVFLKRGCPTAYTYAFDDVTSTFTCATPGVGDGGINAVNYKITFGDANMTTSTGSSRRR